MHRPPAIPAPSRGGFTFLELSLVMVVMLVGAMMLSSTIAMVSKQRSNQRERAAAAEGARSVLERMRARTASEVFALFNADESDDPAGPGTAPGAAFFVEGLQPVDGDPDGFVGEIRFPTVIVSDPADPVDLELREDLEDPTFGTPRDLNGDSIVDDADHTGDYFVLPVQVRVRWAGKSGEREYRTYTTLCDFQWD